MRKIKYIVIHCTATDQTATVQAIQRYWKERLGWKSPGYHHLIEADGTINDLQPIEKLANGVKGYNAESIHISYIGGKFTDDRTNDQKHAIKRLVHYYHKMFPEAEILGHCDFPNVKKNCPRFNVADEVGEWLNINN